jgi:membrane protease YdiL (CAAX protease family)
MNHHFGSPPPLPLSFEQRMARLRLWPLLPLWFLPSVAVGLLEHDIELPQVWWRRLASLLSCALVLTWWVMRAAPRPYSVRATFGRRLDLAGWAYVVVSLCGATCLRWLWWIARASVTVTVAGTTVVGAPAWAGRPPFFDTVFDEVFFAILLMPVVEELLFRGTLFRTWRVRIGPAKAALLSSLIFGLFHLDWVGAFITGLTYPLLYTRTRSLWAPLAFHIFNNALPVVLKLWSPQMKPPIEHWLIYGVFLPVCLIGIGLWVQFVRKSWRTLGDPLPPDFQLDTGNARPGTQPHPVADPPRMAVS